MTILQFTKTQQPQKQAKPLALFLDDEGMNEDDLLFARWTIANDNYQPMHYWRHVGRNCGSMPCDLDATLAYEANCPLRSFEFEFVSFSIGFWEGYTYGRD